MSTNPLYTPSTDVQLVPASGWRVVYFDAANRGECLRLILTAAEVEFDDVRVTFPKGAFLPSFLASLLPCFLPLRAA